MSSNAAHSRALPANPATTHTTARKRILSESTSQPSTSNSAPNDTIKTSIKSLPSTILTSTTATSTARPRVVIQKSLSPPLPSTSLLPLPPVYKSLSDVHLEGELTDSVPIYDDCNQIRRKIAAHLGEGNKITHLLKEMGGINSNSYSRFSKEKGANGGAANQVYYHAYVYFEKLRIFNGKPKTKTRLDNEATLGSQGFPREQRRHGWVMGGAAPKRRRT